MSDISLIENYIYLKKLNLDVQEQKETAHSMYDIIKKNFSKDNDDFSGQSTLTTALFGHYNYLLYPLPGISKLYNQIRETFHICNKMSNMEIYDEYHIQCWLNFFTKGQLIDWHGHWPKGWESWHGFYCVDVEPDSKTSYRIPNHMEEIEIPSRDNLLVLSRSDGDLHKSSKWEHEDRPRITIAFDILPTKLFHKPYVDLIGRDPSHLNHWIPL